MGCLYFSARRGRIYQAQRCRPYIGHSWKSWALLTLRYVVLLVIPTPYIALFILSRSDPGIITPQNYLAHIDLFPYDNVLFTPHNKCRTCQFSKPARSKHCNACGVCVARHDHHCYAPRLPAPLTSRRLDW